MKILNNRGSLFLRGEVNQVYSYQENLLASNEKIIVKDSVTSINYPVTLDTLKPKKKPFIPTPSNAAKAGFLMYDSIVDGKKVKIIKEDLSSPNAKGKPKEEAKNIASSGGITTGSSNVMIGSMAGRMNTAFGSSAGQSFPDDVPKPGERLYPCKYCDMQRTIAHIKYIAKMHGEGYVEISKGVWMKTD